MGVLTKRVLEAALGTVSRQPDDCQEAKLLCMCLFAVKRIVEQRGLWEATAILKHISHADGNDIDVKQAIEDAGSVPQHFQEVDR